MPNVTEPISSDYSEDKSSDNEDHILQCANIKVTDFKKQNLTTNK